MSEKEETEDPGEDTAKVIISKTAWFFTFVGLGLQLFLVYQVVVLGIQQNQVEAIDIALYVIVILFSAVSYFNWYYTLLLSDYYTNSERNETFNYFYWLRWLERRITPENSGTSGDVASSLMIKHKSVLLAIPALLTAFELELLLAQSLLIGEDPFALALTAVEIVFGIYKVVEYYLTARKSKGVAEVLGKAGIKFCCITDVLFVIALFLGAPLVLIQAFVSFFTIPVVLGGSIVIFPVSSYYIVRYSPWCSDGRAGDSDGILGLL